MQTDEKEPSNNRYKILKNKCKENKGCVATDNNYTLRSTKSKDIKEEN